MSSRLRLGLAAACASAWLASSSAQAQSWIRQPGRHDTTLEVEVHGVVGYRFGGVGYYSYFSPGVGVRFGIPLMRNGFVSSINNSVAINFGADLLFWPCADRDQFGGCAVGLALQAPVVLQWSFMLAERFSLFTELGLAPTFGLYSRFYNYDCGGPQAFWCFGTPALAIGGRYHWRGQSQFPTFTFRFGFPVQLTLGVSF